MPALLIDQLSLWSGWGGCRPDPQSQRAFRLHGTDQRGQDTRLPGPVNTTTRTYPKPARHDTLVGALYVANLKGFPMTEPTDPTFSDAVTPATPTPAVPVPVDAPVTPVAPAEPVIALTASQIQAMIQQAVESAIGSMARFNPAVAAPPEPVRPYTPAELFTKIVHYTPWHTERERLSAFAGVEALYPISVDGE